MALIKFVVERTSVSHPGRPCDEAAWSTVTRIEKAGDVMVRYDEAAWLSQGYYHGWHTEDMLLNTRKILTNAWTVEFESAEELHSFMDKYEQVVVSYDAATGLRKVEIYDAARE